MSKTFNVRLPVSHPHISQTFHLLWQYTLAEQITGETGPAEHDLFVTAVADHNELLDFAKPESRLGQHLREYVEVGRAAGRHLVIDGATEGWAFEPGVFEHFHRNLAELGIGPREVLLISTNHLLPSAYQAWALGRGLEPIGFFIFDFWCYKLSVQLREQLAGKPADAPDLTEPSFVVDKKLLSFNRVPKAHRAAVILKLIGSGQIDNSLVSFMPDVAAVSPEQLASSYTYFRALGWPTLNRLLDRWPELVARLPIVHDQDAGTEYLSYVFGNLRSADYARVGFTVITESDFGVHSVDRVTEKPFKAVANHCPFLIVGQQRQLARMRALGFEPYDMFDNSYDDIVNPNLRLDAVLREMDRLSRLGTGDLQALRLSVHDATVRNFRLLVEYGAEAKVAEVAAALGRTLASVRGTPG